MSMPPVQDASDSFKRRDAASYSPVASSFDTLSRRFTAVFARRTLDLARLEAGERVLDVGTGSGILLQEAVDRLGGTAVPTGIDLSPGMLARSRRTLDHAVHLARCDAESLAFASASFDVVLSLFALAHLPNPLESLREMARVLRPGGRLVVGVGGPPPRLSRAGLVDFAERILARVQVLRGRRLEAPASLEGLIEQSWGRSSDRLETAVRQKMTWRPMTTPKLVSQAGFHDLQIAWLGAATEVDSADDFWTLQAVFSSRARKRLQGAAREARDTLRAEFLTRCRQVQEAGGRLVYPRGVLFVVARAPHARSVPAAA